jgi:membrane protease YdiL (CAAX protease family)
MKLLPVAILAMIVGPSVAGLLMTALVAGRAGLAALLSSLLRWRVSARWYAVALLTAPLLILAVLLPLALFSSEYLPAISTTGDKAALLMMGIMAGLMAGIVEEIGWTGFAIPRLRLRHSMLATGLTVGLLWGAWHLLVYVWGSGDASGEFSWALFLPTVPVFFGILPAFRMLMVWVYDHTESLLVAMLMHVSLTASTQILMPAAIGMPGFIYSLILTAVLWVVVAVVVATQRGQTARPPLRGQMA